jgi:hypothetical protein
MLVHYKSKNIFIIKMYFSILKAFKPQNNHILALAGWCGGHGFRFRNS